MYVNTYYIQNKEEKKTAAICGLALNIVLLIGIALFIQSHQTYYKYNDWSILGSDINSVYEKYGEFDVGSIKQGQKGTVGYYIYTDDGPVMPDHSPHYYYLYYDENGIVYKVAKSGAWGG